MRDDAPGPERPGACRPKARRLRPRKQSHPPSHLPLGWRVFFVVSGWLLVLLGIAGLALPGIQGVLTIIAGAALLSAASETSYWVLRRAFRRWPWGWRKLERSRRRIYRRLVGKPRPRGGRPGAADGGGAAGDCRGDSDVDHDGTGRPAP
jgi:peptidoglycan/LPS O-acetylase OafA/YrhL